MEECRKLHQWICCVGRPAFKPRNRTRHHFSSRLLTVCQMDAIVIAEVFSKKTGTTPKSVIETCQKRLREYDDA